MRLRRGLGRDGRAHRHLRPAHLRTVAVMGLVVLGLHALGAFLLLAAASGHRHSSGAPGSFGVGIGVTAYTLGLRHAFDADHISAIDNTTRKLMSEGRRPLSVGFLFSLGHSTVVFALTFSFAAGLRALRGAVSNQGSALHSVTHLIGTVVSGTFLYIIAALNAGVMWGVIKVCRELRAGCWDAQRLEEQLGPRGAMTRVFGRLTGAVATPWHVYLIGVLFGLGFDTATEIALVIIAAGAAGAALPFYAVLCLPILFAAGMSLLDTIDGCFMNFAYGWAFSKPLRKIFYNAAITGLSVVVAVVVGTIELAGLLAQELGARGSLWTALERINVNTLGFLIVGLFAGVWAIAAAVWRLARVQERLGAGVLKRDGVG